MHLFKRTHEEQRLISICLRDERIFKLFTRTGGVIIIIIIIIIVIIIMIIIIIIIIIIWK